MAKGNKTKKVREEEYSVHEDENNGNELQDEENHTETPKMKRKRKHKEKLDVKIKILGENPDKVSPIIGYFPSGYDPFKNRRQEEGEGELEKEGKVKLYKHVKRNKRLQLVASPDDSQVDFVGTNYAGEATTAEMCNFCLGVLDKSTQTLKLVPIAANRILRMEPIVRGSGSLEIEAPDTEKQKLTKEQKAKTLDDLTTKYSTKKNIRQAQKLESLRQTEDAEAQQNLNRKIDINEALEIAATTSDARNVPPHDLSATTPEAAYPLDGIIFNGDWEQLDEILWLLESGDGVGSGSYPSFVCNRLSRLDEINDEVEKRQLAGIFSYITHLIKFKDRHSDHFQSAKHHKIPKIFSQRFNDMFADPDSKWLLNEKRDLLINYILVLTLHVDNFRTDPSDIAKDLRMDVLALRRHYEFLGCKFVREKLTSLATLTLPLKFKTVNRQRGKRNR